MFGQASPRWPASTALVLMVALFGVHLNSDLYLASPVTANPGHSNDTTDPTHVAALCMVAHYEETETCQKKAAKEDFAEITDKECIKRFSLTKCTVEILCGTCKDDKVEFSLKKTSDTLEKAMKEECKQWESKAPKVACEGGGQRSGDASDKPSYLIYIIVVVVLVVAVVIAVVVYCLMCTGDSKGSSAKPGKSSKGSKSMKAGKSTKSGIKGGKSTKSAKSAKSGKSLKGGKSTKSKKSTKSSKGGKSAKK